MNPALSRVFRGRRVLVAVAVGAGLLLGLPSAAHADYVYWMADQIDPCLNGDQFQCDEGKAKAATGGKNWRDSSGQYNAVLVEFHPYGEHVIVLDHYTNGRYAWAHVLHEHDGTRDDYKIRSAYHVDRNYDWPEDHVVWVRACEGTYSDYDRYGCGEWGLGRA